MFDSVRPHRWKPTRISRPWDSPGKSTGVGCHFLLQCVKVKSEREVTQSCLTLRDPMDCSPPGSSTHGIFQARVLEWGAIAFSSSGTWYLLPQGMWDSTSPIRDQTRVFCAGMCLVAQLCPTLCNPMDCSLPGSSGHGIL